MRWRGNIDNFRITVLASEERDQFFSKVDFLLLVFFLLLLLFVCLEWNNFYSSATAKMTLRGSNRTVTIHPQLHFMKEGKIRSISSEDQASVWACLGEERRGPLVEEAMLWRTWHRCGAMETQLVRVNVWSPAQPTKSPQFCTKSFRRDSGHCIVLTEEQPACARLLNRAG